MYSPFSKKATLFKGDIIQGRTLFKEIRYIENKLDVPYLMEESDSKLIYFVNLYDFCL